MRTSRSPNRIRRPNYTNPLRIQPRNRPREPARDKKISGADFWGCDLYANTTQRYTTHHTHSTVQVR